MKKCIWCKRDESETRFEKQAHTIPKSLGGKNICQNVCDECNLYFGSITDQLPAIEETIKETFNITRARMLNEEDIGPNKSLVRFKSKYFNLNFKNRKISLKPQFQLKRDFQKKLANQLRRGMYKMYLEELERQQGTAIESKLDFIREFSRYNKGNLPLFYFKKKYGLFFNVDNWVKSPELMISNYRMKYLINNDHFFEFEFLGHTFAIVKSVEWKAHFEAYIKESWKTKEKFFNAIIIVEQLTEIDLTLSIMDKNIL